MKIQFRWVGLNKHFKEIQIQDGLTLDKIRNGHAWTFFAESNKGEYGNCKFLGEDLFSGLVSQDGVDAYFNDVILYQNTEGQTREAKLWYDNRENCLMVGNFPYHVLFNSAYIQPSKLEFKIVGNTYEIPDINKQ